MMSMIVKETFRSTIRGYLLYTRTDSKVTREVLLGPTVLKRIFYLPVLIWLSGATNMTAIPVSSLTR